LHLPVKGQLKRDGEESLPDKGRLKPEDLARRQLKRIFFIDGFYESIIFIGSPN
jgi:hypothetical protein